MAMVLARIAVLALFACAVAGDEPREARASSALPAVAATAAGLDDVLRHRRSVRSFSSRALSVEAVGKLCWAAQGVTDPATGHRTAPSAGALYPLELYVVDASGVRRYDPRDHSLARVSGDDRRGALATAALGQDAVRHAPTLFVLTGVVSRTRAKYGDRAERYVWIEAGHAAQNLLLEATALGLGAVPIGAFSDADVRRAIGASADESPIYVLAVGHTE